MTKKTPLTIASLKNARFDGPNVHCIIRSGYGLYAEGHGFVSFAGANVKNGVKTPYTNTRKVLQSIIDAGGLVHYDNIEWLTPAPTAQLAHK